MVSLEKAVDVSACGDDDGASTGRRCDVAGCCRVAWVTGPPALRWPVVGRHLGVPGSDGEMWSWVGDIWRSLWAGPVDGAGALMIRIGGPPEEVRTPESSPESKKLSSCYSCNTSKNTNVFGRNQN